MNAALRAVIRKTLYMGHSIYAIMNGYQGMVENNIKQLVWEDAGGILSEVFNLLLSFSFVFSHVIF